MIEQEKLPEWIDRFNRKELNDEELEKFLQWMEEDPQLKKEVMLDKELNSILDDQDILDLRKKILSRKKKNELLRKRFLLAAAVIVMLAALFVLYQFVLKEMSVYMKENKDMLAQDTTILQETDSTGTKMSVRRNDNNNPETLTEKSGNLTNRENTRELYASNYEPFPPFESLVETVTRAGYFKLTGPRGIFFIKNSYVRFSWETNLSQTLNLKILNNKGLAVREASLPQDGKWLLNIAGLKPGLYYFKILMSDEIIYFGKFELE